MSRGRTCLKHDDAVSATDLGELVGVGRLHAVLRQYSVEAFGVVLGRPDAGDVRHRSRFLAGFFLGQRLAERPGAGATLKVGGDGGGSGQWSDD